MSDRHRKSKECGSGSAEQRAFNVTQHNLVQYTTDYTLDKLTKVKVNIRVNLGPDCFDIKLAAYSFF